ncbi:MAG: hypothetical protein WD960_16195 [Gemmatimonadota bacterium]
MLHNQAGPGALGVLRITVFAVWILAVLGSLPLTLAAGLPRELFEAPGVLALLPEPFWEVFLRETTLVAFTALLLVALVAAAAGAGPFSIVGPLAFLGVLLFDGLQKGFAGYFNHNQFGLLYATFFVAISPAADALSLERSRGGQSSRPPRPPGVYRFPLVASALALSLTYFLVGSSRVAIGGWEIFASDALPGHLALRTMEHTATNFRLSFLLLAHAPLVFLLKAGFLVTTVFEVLSPLALLRRGFRLAWLGVIVPFHFATLLTMNIFFWENVVLLALLFTDLPRRVEEWVGAGRRRGRGATGSRPGQ